MKEKKMTDYKEFFNLFYGKKSNPNESYEDPLIDKNLLLDESSTELIHPPFDNIKPAHA